MATRRDDGFTALIEDDVVQAIGVVGAIGDHLGGRQALDQITSWRHVVLLTGPDLETDRQAERVYDGVELGAEAAAGATESLGFRSPLLRRAPAACACARMTVASSIIHSRSGSPATASNSRSNTPASIQR